MMQAPFGEIRSVLTDRATAQQSSGESAPELFLSLFITPEGTIGNQLDATRAFMRLRTLDGTPLQVPASGGQSIAGVGEASVVLLVERDASLPAAGGEGSDAAFRAASTMIDSGDEAVRALAASATASLPPDASARDRAEAARQAVHAWITRKGLSTAFASASETVRNRQGDCSEHGVLLAAVLRAEGIPSRVASGLVWMDRVGSFGWHMWTQALIDGAWVDLDATLPIPFTVGHILVATSPLEDGDGQRQLMTLLGLLGNLEIEIVRVDR
jgi:transglutaminase-like putative cysteine protease